MTEAIDQTVERVNMRLAQVLRNMQASLRGECRFAANDVRSLSTVLAEMEPVIIRSAELRRSKPGIAGQLDLYKSQLLELQNTVEKLRVTLLVQKASVESSRDQVTAVSQWCTAFRQTR